MISETSSFQGLIRTLQSYWAERGCVIHQPFDLEMGAGTFHPATFLRALGPEPWQAAYVQPVRRPGDGRYGENPNRLQHYYQFQVVLKPSWVDIQEQYLHSLVQLGFNPLQHDIRFVEDNWESPTLGAWGLGWEVWLDGMEISQFTYFQQVGGLNCQPVMGELTYGLERIAMAMQQVDNVYDIIWTRANETPVYYGELYRQNETEMSRWNFELRDVERLFDQFHAHETECHTLIEAMLPIPAYESVIKASHVFNLLDARHAISVSERQRYLLRVRNMAKQIANAWLVSRERLGFPLLQQAEDGNTTTSNQSTS